MKVVLTGEEYNNLLEDRGKDYLVKDWDKKFYSQFGYDHANLNTASTMIKFIKEELIK